MPNAREPSPGASPPSAAELVAELGVVLVAHARVDLALACIDTLPRLPPERLVAVVNLPAAADPDGLAELGRRATVVSPDHAQGYGANLNLGVRALRLGVPYLLLANDDVEFGEGTVDKLLEPLDHDSRVGIVGPAITQVNGRQPPLQPQFPTRLAVALNTAVLPLGPAWQHLSRRAGLIAPADEDERARNGWVIGAAMLVRAEAFAAVGGFDEEFHLYYEEIDFCYRVRAAGWRIAWRADAPAVHVHASSTGGSHLARSLFASERLYFRKRHGAAALAVFEAALIGLYAVSWLYNVVVAVLRPTTARRRLDLLKARWGTRLFLRPRNRTGA
jgi:N-acetylglucosaminyl-diphospho-decaprenol L-rhamnosyltransferase